jgi:hypothetical protein
MSHQESETHSIADEALAKADDGAAITEAQRSTPVEPAAVGADENPPGETNAAAAPSEPADGLHGAETAASDAGAPTATPDLPVLQDTLSPLVDLAGNGGPVLLVGAATASGHCGRASHGARTARSDQPVLSAWDRRASN